MSQQNLILCLTVFLALITGCDNKPPANLKYPSLDVKSDLTASYSTLDYLNTIRVKAGLSAFTRNEKLDIAAHNHALYLSSNKISGHDQTKGMPNFSGETLKDRAFFAGYNSTLVGENIAHKQDFKSSTDGLFTAIYHRFGFLNPSYDEIGFAHSYINNFDTSVFVMGNKTINKICEGKGENGYGKFYTNVCKNPNLQIKEDNFQKATTLAYQKKIVFPYNNSDNVPILFSGEVPDPMPSCKITANPISIQFPTNEKNIDLLSFKVFEGESELKNTRIITSANDVNKRFGKYDFALFPLDVYKYNTTYNAVFSYMKNGKEHKTSWSFATKTPSIPYFTIDEDSFLAIEADKYYEIFFRPKDCNDLLTTFSHNSSPRTNFTRETSGINTLKVKVSGRKGDSVDIITNSNTRVTLILQNSSENANHDRARNIAIGFVVLLIAFIAGTMRLASR